MEAALAQRDIALQHGPRPLPLFLNILWRETEGNEDLRQRALAGLRRYQGATRPPMPDRPVASVRSDSAILQRYGTENGRYPVIFVPSLINPPHVLDLSPARSMLRHMAAAGHDVHLVDWGVPAAVDRDLDLAGHVTDRLMPLLTTLNRPPIIIGYCLGGTLALACAALRPVRALVTMAAPWHFDAFAAADRDALATLWATARPLCDRLGYLPMEVLQSAFWALDPARTIRKYATFADYAAGSNEEAAFLALEDWANQGPPLTYAAGRDLFERLYAANASGLGQWSVSGRIAGELPETVPTLAIRSTADRIVPAEASPRLKEIRQLPAGHVGMVVGSRAPEILWNPLSQWLCSHGG